MRSLWIAEGQANLDTMKIKHTLMRNSLMNSSNLAFSLSTKTGSEGPDSGMTFGFGSLCKLRYRPILAKVAAL